MERKQKYIDYFWIFFVVTAGHLLLWTLLIAVYPRLQLIRSVFFWNRRVRWFIGLGYAPWVITQVSFLRRRLFLPFQQNLIPNRYRHEFQFESYYGASRITAIQNGKPVTCTATEYLRPIRGQRVVEAPAGFGKTTLIQWLVHQPEAPCIILRAAECANGVMETIYEYLPEIDRNDRFLEVLVCNGGVNLLIDGLNEADPATRETIRAFLNDRFRGNYVLTTQPILGFKPPRNAEIWRLQPLAVDDARQFLLHQWSRVEEYSTAARISQPQYEASVLSFMDNIRMGSETDPFVLANPLDATLVADLIARNVSPDPVDLIAQHFRLARSRCLEIAPGREPRFNQIGRQALELTRGTIPRLDLAGLEPELAALLEQKLLSQHGTELFFRHERIRDYLIAIALGGVSEALNLKDDARFTGVFEFLPEIFHKTIGKTEADDLGMALKAESANSVDSLVNLVWARYRRRWKEPSPQERAEDLRRRADQKRARVVQSLVEVFPTPKEITDLSEEVLNIPIENIPGIEAGMDATSTISLLVGWATENGRLAELIIGAVALNPLASQLKQLANQFEFTANVPGEVERINLKDVPFENVGQWLDKFTRLRRAVCRIEPQPPPNTNGYGTGFLIAPDVMLTNFHVIEPFLERNNDKITVRFDYEAGKDGITVASGRVCKLASGWRLIDSPVKELDFALVRLAESVGNDTVPDGVRGVVPLVSKSPTEAGSPLIILQHPAAAPLKLAIGSIVDPNAATQRVSYTVNTEPGSSGSPCFSSGLDLIALHHWGGKPNRGVQITAIRRKLLECKSELIAKGIDNLLNENPNII